MLKRLFIVTVLFIMIMCSTVVNAEEFKYVEIFSPKQDKVVKVVQMNNEIYNMVSTWLKNIDGIYGKNNPITDNEYAVRIPINPSIKVQGKWLNTFVNEVYLIIPQNDTPFLMIFENKDKLSCFPFNGDVNKLSISLGFKLNRFK